MDKERYLSIMRKYNEALSATEPRNWAGISIGDKLRALAEIANKYAEEIGKEFIKVEPFNTAHYDKSVLGMQWGDTIYINMKLLNEQPYKQLPNASLREVLHQIRHIYQQQAINGALSNPPSNDVVKRWKVDFDSIKLPDDDIFLDPYSAIEADANHFTLKEETAIEIDKAKAADKAESIKLQEAKPKLAEMLSKAKKRAEGENDRSSRPRADKEKPDKGKQR
ncbi:MAG: hypothetical protein FWG30_03590 [Eubacteriaceae bacterium]|nr:hypothetical protein [Eubacteriaceae bacterium]